MVNAYKIIPAQISLGSVTLAVIVLFIEYIY